MQELVQEIHLRQEGVSHPSLVFPNLSAFSQPHLQVPVLFKVKSGQRLMDYIDKAFLGGGCCRVCLNRCHWETFKTTDRLVKGSLLCTSVLF